ncbi:protein of unknown function [Candidatus Nitrosocosmicus franklandus]|uniref:Uncharacterized protein n=1 Tax=Candidatus Nitrosocosmicus franklandianus TaxID=1798806 RepID=A0A484IFJ5_9ARCH|nr:protein of unknown function [Candidatus Nitrosocosmicus franklandus]
MDLILGWKIQNVNVLSFGLVGPKTQCLDYGLLNQSPSGWFYMLHLKYL